MNWWESLVDIVERGAKAKKKLDRVRIELDVTGLPPDLDARVLRLAQWSTLKLGRPVTKLQLVEILVTLAEKESCKVQAIANNPRPSPRSTVPGGPSSSRKV